jgi:hypothetical protein
MGTLKTDLKQGIDETLFELEKLSDQIRLKMHLASMDARDSWTKLEPRLDEARAHAKEAGEASQKAVADIFAAFKTFGDSL